LGYWYNEVGEAETSDLGLERANMIRDILIEQGFNPDQITTSSRGQSEPLADNTTESGIRENSRVEIFINE
jgi:outer membrane protein OmpA-like peptidoglycan-associated protein